MMSSADPNWGIRHHLKQPDPLCMHAKQCLCCFCRYSASRTHLRAAGSLLRKLGDALQGALRGGPQGGAQLGAQHQEARQQAPLHLCVHLQVLVHHLSDACAQILRVGKGRQ